MPETKLHIANQRSKVSEDMVWRRPENPLKLAAKSCETLLLSHFYLDSDEEMWHMLRQN